MKKKKVDIKEIENFGVEVHRHGKAFFREFKHDLVNSIKMFFRQVDNGGWERISNKRYLQAKSRR